MTINCEVCGTANPDGTKYCEGCGIELTAAPTSGAAQSSTPAVGSVDNADSTITPATPPLETPPLETPPLEPATPAQGSGTPVVIEPPTSEVPGQDQPVAATTDSAVPTPAEVAPTSDAAPSEAPIDSAAVSSEPVISQPVESESVPPPTTSSESLPVTETPAQPEAATPAVPTETPAPAETPVAASLAAPATTSTGEAKLNIKKFGAPSADFIPLQGERMVVGRFDASTGPVDIDLSGLTGQEHISRRHAELYKEEGVWKVRDLGSTNGVYVKRNGESSFSPRLQEPATLADGDEIAFGNLMMTFHQG